MNLSPNMNAATGGGMSRWKKIRGEGRCDSRGSLPGARALKLAGECLASAQRCHKMAAFLNVPNPPRGHLSGRWGAWRPVRSMASLLFGRIKSPDLGCSRPQPETGGKGARAEGLGHPSAHSAVSTKSALNPNACWPVATLDVGLDYLHLSEK